MNFVMRWTTRMEEEAAQAVPTAHTTMGVAAQAVPMDLITMEDAMAHLVQKFVQTAAIIPEDAKVHPVRIAVTMPVRTTVLAVVITTVR